MRGVRTARQDEPRACMPNYSNGLAACPASGGTTWQRHKSHAVRRAAPGTKQPLPGVEWSLRAPDNGAAPRLGGGGRGYSADTDAYGGAQQASSVVRHGLMRLEPFAKERVNLGRSLLHMLGLRHWLMALHRRDALATADGGGGSAKQQQHFVGADGGGVEATWAEVEHASLKCATARSLFKDQSPLDMARVWAAQQW